MQCLLVRTRMWLVCYLPNAVRLQRGLALHRNMSTVYRNGSIRECAKSSLECRQVKLVFWWCPWTGGISAGNKQSTPNNSKPSNYPNHQPAADDLMTIPETARTSLVSPRPTDPPSVLKEGDVLLEVRVANPLMKPWYSLNICKAQSSKQTIDPHLLQPCMCICKNHPISRRHRYETHAVHAGRKIQGGQFWSSQDAICSAQIEHLPQTIHWHWQSELTLAR